MIRREWFLGLSGLGGVGWWFGTFLGVLGFAVCCNVGGWVVLGGVFGVLMWIFWYCGLVGIWVAGMVF